MLFRSALILHVTDISSPSHVEQEEEVRKVLAELGVENTPRLLVGNKVDLLEEEDRRRLKNSARVVFISAQTGEGLEELSRQLDASLPGQQPVRVQLRLTASDGRRRALVHRRGRVLAEEFRDGKVLIDAELPAFLAEELRNFTVR